MRLETTIHGTKSQTVGVGTRLHGRRSRQVPAVILLLLRTCASHQTDTSGIVDQSYNANCPAILVQKSETQAPELRMQQAGEQNRQIGRSRKQSRSTDSCAIHGFLRNVWIHRLRSAIHGLRRSTDCAQHT